MPTSLYIHITPDRPLRLQPYTSSGLGWLLSLIYQVDPALSEALHQASAVKTFSVSTWLAVTDEDIELERSGEPRSLIPAASVAPGSRVSLRVTAASDHITTTILMALAEGNVPPLAGTPVAAVDYPAGFSPSESVDCFECPWEALLAAPPATRIDLCFAAPTAFSSQGRAILLPETKRILDSWSRKWTAWGGPASLAMSDIDAMAADILVDSYQLSTSIHGNGQARNRGFSGYLAWMFSPGTTPESRSAVATLAGFANFSGTGAKTNFGFGQTRAQVT